MEALDRTVSSWVVTTRIDFSHAPHITQGLYSATDQFTSLIGYDFHGASFLGY